MLLHLAIVERRAKPLQHTMPHTDVQAFDIHRVPNAAENLTYHERKDIPEFVIF